jgi:hypothetical protein
MQTLILGQSSRNDERVMKSIADEITKLHELLSSGTISQDEFALRMSTLRLHDDLLRIDQDWQIEREHHKVTYGRHSEYVLPNAFGAVGSFLAGGVGIGFGIFWFGELDWLRKINKLQGMPAVVLLLFGLLFVVCGVSIPIYQSAKYFSYRSAYAAYQHRRSEVIETYEKEGRRFKENKESSGPLV